MEYDIKDIKLAPIGKNRIAWAAQDMQVLKQVEVHMKQEKPFKGMTVGACLHVTAETANLMIVLKAGGAKVFLCASNPLSTQDDVAASLVKDYAISVFAIKGEDDKTYYKHINKVLDQHPHLTMDDGADLVSELHKNRPHQLAEIIAGTEETTTGVIRLKAMAANKKLQFPVLAVNDSMTKHFFDNRYGTGQSTLDAILRLTNKLIAGSHFVVCGYGYCGKGIAMRARGMGAQVTVTEINPVKALEALMDGFQVDKLENIVGKADFVVSSTGSINIIDKKHIQKMKNGAIIAQSGHFNVEINIPELEKMAKTKTRIKYLVDEYDLGDKKVYLLAEGRLVNIAGAEGHPASVMDMSFANQALAAEYMLKNARKLENIVYVLPEEIDSNIASLKLKTLGVKIDKLTPEQKKYLSSWESGT